MCGGAYVLWSALIQVLGPGVVKLQSAKSACNVCTYILLGTVKDGDSSFNSVCDSEFTR